VILAVLHLHFSHACRLDPSEVERQQTDF